MRPGVNPATHYWAVDEKKAATSAASFHREETPGKGDNVNDAACEDT
jgi:hypothetical protein